MKTITLSCRILFILLFTIPLIYGQTKGQKRIDSLKTAASSKVNDTNKVKALNILAYELRGKEPQLALSYGEEALKLAEKLKWKKGMATGLKNIGIVNRYLADYYKSIESLKKALKLSEEIHDKFLIKNCLSNMGLTYDLLSDYGKALEYMEKSLKLSEELGDKTSIAKDLANIGVIYYDLSNYPVAIVYKLKSLKLLEELGDKLNMAKGLTNLGSTYTAIGDFSKALECQEKALKLSEELGEKYLIALCLYDISSIYSQQFNDAKALEYGKRSLKLFEELGDKHFISDNLNGIAITYNDQGNYPKALEYENRALKIAEEIGDKKGCSEFMSNIADIYNDMHDYNTALEYGTKSLKTARETGALSMQRTALSVISETFTKMGQDKKALECYKQYIAIRDSEINENSSKKMVQVQMQYEFDKKESLAKAEQEKKDALAKKELQKQKLQKYFFLGGIGLVLLLFFFVYRIYRVRQELRLHDIRNRIAGDLHDDIGSTLNSISIYAEVARKNDEHHDEALEMIGDASRKIIEAMSDIVWTINAENDSFEKIIFRMKSLAYNLFRAKTIEFTFQADEILNKKKLSMEERRNFYLIFKEAINNLVKYSNATRASITLTNENNGIRLRIRDDGVGFDTSQDNTGNGLKNMKRRADEMKAEFKIESQAGSGTQIELILKG